MVIKPEIEFLQAQCGSADENACELLMPSAFGAHGIHGKLFIIHHAPLLNLVCRLHYPASSRTKYISNYSSHASGQCHLYYLCLTDIASGELKIYILLWMFFFNF